ncbi:putative inorganic carbon transporter subunit DabA [uncultured Methylobacterium sp.]|uniref:putative inorganic carbon transporter subunit DabA n=1 Tax=uncultured Methylobacterium sp. TaxID=157278 RepID=UPI0025923B6E|nr:putative inorganic carbon transporter subunit DabA [uncultured Methylobacterium sp.]
MTERTFSDPDTIALVGASEMMDASSFASSIATTARTEEVRLRQVEAAVGRACGRIAPVWPLKNFVAVNPFLGLTDESFVSACARLKRVTGANALMPRRFFRTAFEAGRITGADLRQALTRNGSGDVSYLAVTKLEQAIALDPPQAPMIATTVADLATERGWLPSGLVTDEIGKWCAAFWDEGQAFWRMPWHDQGFYRAWRLAAAHDRTPEVMGLRGFRSALDALPEDPLATIERVVEQLALPEAAYEDYLHRALALIGGWAAYARYRGWEHELCGEADDTLMQLLAVRLAWESALFAGNTSRSFRLTWSAAAERMARLQTEPLPVETMIDGVLQDAYECGAQRQILQRLAAAPAPAETASAHRPAVQAAFCIDVRSEVFRRALETASSQVETIGFAGFFGFPIEYVPIGQHQGAAQCPVLLKPRFIVCEAVQDASASERQKVLERRVVLRRIHKAWKAFKNAAVSCFSYIETAGLLFGPKLVSDTQGLTRTVAWDWDCPVLVDTASAFA